MKKIEFTLEEKARKAALHPKSDPSALVQNLDSNGQEKPKKKKGKEESKGCDPDDIPVVVIDGYMSREKGPHAKELWTFLADWAAVLVENHVAHVIFISNNVTASKPLSKGEMITWMSTSQTSEVSLILTMSLSRSPTKYDIRNDCPLGRLAGIGHGICLQTS